MLILEHEKWGQSYADLILRSGDVSLHTRTRERFRALARVADGKSAVKVALELNLHHHSVLAWIRMYNQGGPDAIKYKHTGAPLFVSRKPKVASASKKEDGSMVDNFQLILRDSSREHFNLAIQIAMSRFESATHYASHPQNGVVLFWHQPEMEVFSVPGLDATWRGDSSATETDFRVPVKELLLRLTSPLATLWLWYHLHHLEYSSEPDHDGVNEKGYHITTGDGWGQIGNSHYTILQVAPLWMRIGK